MIDKKVLEYSRALKKFGIENKVFEHPHLENAGEVVANLGYSLDDSVATLIMKVNNNFVAILRRDVTKISFKKIKKILNSTSLRIASPEEFIKVTGLPVGTARFFVENIKILIDKKVFEKELILGGTGSFTCTLQCHSKDLKKLPNIQVVDISTEIEEISEDSSGVKRVFSGIRATGRLHLGNYLGAVKGMLEIQNTGEYETIYCVVDVHSITTPYDKDSLAKNKREIIIDYLAAGLDPKKSILIYQSDIPEHIELAFYFSTVVTIARMLHLPTYKEKIKQHPKNVTMALLNYPVLMASDILIYKAGLVPVGIDQEPHLEVAREIARKMNQIYGTDFPEPVRFATSGEYIPSLTGEGKMSKTVANSFINLTDSFEEIRKKISKIPTDSGQTGGEIPDSGGIKSLYVFYKMYFPNNFEEDFNKPYKSGNIRYQTIKENLAQAIYEELKPFQERRAKIAADQKYVDEVIKDGAARARKIARETVREVKEKMGLI